jgi:hypothetical protein
MGNFLATIVDNAQAKLKNALSQIEFRAANH